MGAVSGMIRVWEVVGLGSFGLRAGVEVLE